jgi:Cu/Zn superoxide dismutase
MGLPPGVHGIHIHEFGDLNSTDGLSAGPHFNPYSFNHSCYPYGQRHVGDIGNITVGADGTGSVTLFRDLITLDGNYSVIGRAIVVHSGVDNCWEISTGLAGSRLLFGVIGIETGVTQNANNPNTYYSGNFLTAVMIPTALNGIVADVKGIVSFAPSVTPGKVRVVARFQGTGLPAYASKGFHIHTYGDLSSMDQSTLAIGSHWNTPLGSSSHGLPLPDGTGPRHVGDMGNVYISWNQQVYFAQDFDIIELVGAYSIIGRSVAIHLIPDDGGANLGNRIAVGVIGLANKGRVFPAHEPAPTDPNPPPSSSSTGMPSAAVSQAQVSLIALVVVFAFLSVLL